MNIRTKLLGSFAIVIVLMVALGLLTYTHMTHTKSAYTEMLQDGDIRYQLKSLQNTITGMSNDERAFLLSKDKQVESQIADKYKAVEALFAKILTNPTLDQENKEAIEQIKGTFEKFYQSSTQSMTLMNTGKSKEALALHFGEERSARKDIETINDALLASIDSEMAADVIDRDQEEKTQNLWMLSLFAAALLAAIILGLLLTRSITRPLKVINKQLREIADGRGDLSRDLDIRTQGELAELAASFNLMIANLRSILTRAMGTAKQVSFSSEQLSESAEQTTRATENIVEATQFIAIRAEREQEQLASAIDAITRMSEGIGSVSEVNEEVAKLAAAASESSTQGTHSIKEVLHEMKEIHEHVQDASGVIESLEKQSQEIGGITSMISEVANRTNLLALNASIEASRAGEHGRGFAVVALEIRKLAEQSKVSAQQITELIQEILSRVNQAVVSMNNVSKKASSGLVKTTQVDRLFQSIEISIEAVSARVQNTSETTSELAESSRSIVRMAETVAAASNEVAASCQNNSAATEEQLATMEEISSASLELTKLADDLHAVLNGFKLS
ncbi:methyl-accepting chemotaxis protein [Paenibacillus sp. CF384]|uniref:methyl-accepting chemotaxis protein n=1 Tax=Paenibacillus sp. CF384 TaxID=1884382 RepID=UPI000897A08F|nr:methyl-accepting chemotaxis protein [Paenibacillus sp. CF384]SDW54909.1 methyl-accepting chemotaxis protein [Paenibacillus sp. CF384]